MIAAPAAGGEVLRRRIKELEGRKLRALWRDEVARANRLLRQRLRLKAELALVERPLR